MAESSETGLDLNPENNLTNFYKWRFSQVLALEKQGKDSEALVICQELIHDAYTPPYTRVRCHLYLAMSDDSPISHAEEALKILDEIKDDTPKDLWDQALALANELHSDAIEYQIKQDAKPKVPVHPEDEYEHAFEDEGKPCRGQLVYTFLTDRADTAIRVRARSPSVEVEVTAPYEVEEAQETERSRTDSADSNVAH